MKTETLEHKEAFELYYSLGPERSNIRVAGLVGKAKGTVDSWAVSFKWKKRVGERDAQIANKLEDETDHEVLRTKKKILTIIRSLIDNTAEFDKKTGEIKKLLVAVDNVSDLDRIVKLYFAMVGQPVVGGSEDAEKEKTSQLSDEQLRSIAAGSSTRVGTA